MIRQPCPHCGGDADPATVCPRSIDCPTCRGRAGGPCYAPSGHRRSELHAARVAAAESMEPACPRCGQTGTSEICDACRRREREPQGDALRLFAPAPAQIPDQLLLG